MQRKKTCPYGLCLTLFICINCKLHFTLKKSLVIEFHLSRSINIGSSYIKKSSDLCLLYSAQVYSFLKFWLLNKCHTFATFLLIVAFALKGLLHHPKHLGIWSYFWIKLHTSFWLALFQTTGSLWLVSGDLCKMLQITQ